MTLQKTLAGSARLSGVGLHSGEKVELELLPAPVDSGVVFVRVDLEGEPRVPARIENLKHEPRRTALAVADAEVHTTEHLMAALWGAGVQNVEVRINSTELPGMDGSALPFYEAICEAGVVEQDAPARTLCVGSPVGVNGGEANIVALQADSNASTLHVSYTLSYPSTPLGTQFCSLRIDQETFAREIAPARTFCLEAEAAALQAAGLGRGATPQNTLVLGEDGQVLENELRFEDEFVRHKILDLIGDLYLVGAHVQGHVVASKSGHDLNAELARSLLREAAVDCPDSNPGDSASGDALVVPPPAAPGELPTWGYKAPLDINAVAHLLPHRYPFLLVDRVLDLDEDGMFVRAVKNVTFGEEYFQGHFPGDPVMPGVLQIEALAQAAGVMLLYHEQNYRCRAYLLSVDKVKFRRKVVPGDQLVLEVRMKSMKKRSAQVEARALVDGKLASEGVIRFMLVAHDA